MTPRSLGSSAGRGLSFPGTGPRRRADFWRATSVQAARGGGSFSRVYPAPRDPARRARGASGAMNECILIRNGISLS